MFSLYLTMPIMLCSSIYRPTKLFDVSRMKPRTASEHVAANILMLAILFTLNYAYLGKLYYIYITL